MANMQASSFISFERLVLLGLFTSGCTLLYIVGITKAQVDQPTPNVQRSNFKPINCYFCDTQKQRDCDSRLDEVKRTDTHGSRTGKCEWIVPRPFRNDIIGIPLRPYCVTFIEEVRGYGKAINYRMVRDCAHPGGEPTDCMQFNKYPNMLTWPSYKSWRNWNDDPAMSVLRQAVFCNDADYCNSMTQAEFEVKCNTGSLRTIDVTTAGNSSSAPVIRGTGWLYAAAMMMPAMLASRSASFFHYVPLLMTTAILTPRVGLFAQADLPKWESRAPKRLTCFKCDTARDGAACQNGDALKGSHGFVTTMESGHVNMVLAGSLGLVNRLDPACVTYLLQEYRVHGSGSDLYAQYLVRKPVWMEGFPEECMNLTDAYTKRKVGSDKYQTGFKAVYIAHFCWTPNCNDINQGDLVDKCYPKLSMAANDEVKQIITNSGWNVAQSYVLKSGEIPRLPPPTNDTNTTGGSASLLSEGSWSILLLSILLATAQAAFSFKAVRLCGVL